MLLHFEVFRKIIFQNDKVIFVNLLTINKRVNVNYCSQNNYKTFQTPAYTYK